MKKLLVIIVMLAVSGNIRGMIDEPGYYALCKKSNEGYKLIKWAQTKTGKESPIGFVKTGSVMCVPPTARAVIDKDFFNYFVQQLKLFVNYSNETKCANISSIENKDSFDHTPENYLDCGSEERKIVLEAIKPFIEGSGNKIVSKDSKVISKQEQEEYANQYHISKRYWAGGCLLGGCLFGGSLLLATGGIIALLAPKYAPNMPYLK